MPRWRQWGGSESEQFCIQLEPLLGHQSGQFLYTSCTTIIRNPHTRVYSKTVTTGPRMPEQSWAAVCGRTHVGDARHNPGDIQQ